MYLLPFVITIIQSALMCIILCMIVASICFIPVVSRELLDGKVIGVGNDKATPRKRIFASRKYLLYNSASLFCVFLTRTRTEAIKPTILGDAFTRWLYLKCRNVIKIRQGAVTGYGVVMSLVSSRRLLIRGFFFRVLAIRCRSRNSRNNLRPFIIRHA